MTRKRSKTRYGVIFSNSVTLLHRSRFNTSCFLALTLFPLVMLAQNIPVSSVSDQYYRSMQLAGELDSTVSFTVRPLTPAILSSDDSFSADSNLRGGRTLFSTADQNGVFRVLPVSWQHKYLSHPSYSRNDGAMIPAKGYQTMLSAGIYTKYGPLSIQLKPEYVLAVNDPSDARQAHYGSADLPVRFGESTYSEIFWGQSSIRLSFDPVSIGLSNENLWWGPGRQNALLMSNSAPGFKHLTLNTTRPVATSIGSFEVQMVAGRLEGSGYTPFLPDDWRYLSGMVFTYRPRWVPGLFLGMTRSFQTYSKDMDGSFGDYFPLFQAFQKVNTNEGVKRRDQLTSVFARWLLKGSHAEVYFEYGLNDHSYNTRDFIMAPEHSRAYTIGAAKLISYENPQSEYIELGLELTHMEQSIDRIFRGAGQWYTHHQVIHGYTHNGQVLGAGIGPGGNLQSLQLSQVKGLDRTGIQLERFEHNGDLANAFGYRQWLDLAVGVVADRVYRNFVFNGKLQGVQSVNYQWQDGKDGRPKKNAFFINAEIGMTYSF